MTTRTRTLLLVTLVTALCLLPTSGRAASIALDTIPPDYPQVLHRTVAALLARHAQSPQDPALLIELAEAYQDLADDALTDEQQRQTAYDAGADAARRALVLDERNADAHFLYATTMGSAERLRGLSNAALSVGDIKTHVARAIELNPTHAQALQFMGGLLAELPWVLGGSDRDAIVYLQRAIAADPNYTNASLLLAKLYLKSRRTAEAKAALESVRDAAHPHFPYTWARTFKPEALRLLQDLERRTR